MSPLTTLPLSAQDVRALYVSDLSAVLRRLTEFSAALPRVRPHYAVKCNPDPTVIQTLASAGACFDVASPAEVSLVRAAVGADALPDRTVYANPCKASAHLRVVADAGVRLMTFDGADELRKIADACPDARLLLRIGVDDAAAAALCPLGAKYGAGVRAVPALLDLADELHLDVVGVAFHVGSGCTRALAYVDALRRARAVFDLAERRGREMSVLDIGGGFPGFDGEAPVTFAEIAEAVRRSVDELFPARVSVIAEPGRYFVAAAFSLAAKVLARRPGERAYVIGDGVFGSFKDAVLLNVQFRPDRVLRADGRVVEVRGVEGVATLYGPTLDGRDVVAKNVPLPAVERGDWLLFRNMGAYTMSLATRRGGGRPVVHYYFSDGGGEDAEADGEGLGGQASSENEDSA